MSRAPKDGLKTLDLTDIEEGSASRRNCINCGHRQNILVKMIHSEIGLIRSKNRIGVCTNPACFRYHDMSQCPSWERDYDQELQINLRVK